MALAHGSGSLFDFLYIERKTHTWTDIVTGGIKRRRKPAAAALFYLINELQTDRNINFLPLQPLASIFLIFVED